MATAMERANKLRVCAQQIQAIIAELDERGVRCHQTNENVLEARLLSIVLTLYQTNRSNPSAVGPSSSPHLLERVLSSERQRSNTTAMLRGWTDNNTNASSLMRPLLQEQQLSSEVLHLQATVGRAQSDHLQQPLPLPSIDTNHVTCPESRHARTNNAMDLQLEYETEEPTRTNLDVVSEQDQPGAFLRSRPMDQSQSHVLCTTNTILKMMVFTLVFVAPITYLLQSESKDGDCTSKHSSNGDSTDLRWESLSVCARKLSNVQDHDWSPHSHSYQAALWFLGPGFHVPLECEWGSPFGDLYALIILRQRLHVNEPSWYSHDHEIAAEEDSIDACKWARVRCDHDGDGKYKVTGLFFNNANLSGTLPEEIGGLVHLLHSEIYDNLGLVGYLPTQLGHLTNLMSLQAHKTDLGGTVPTEIGNLVHLQELLVEDTLLTGSMPASVCKLRRDFSLSTLRATCQGNSAHLDCDCCTLCH